MNQGRSLINVSALTPADVPRAQLLAQLHHRPVTSADFRLYVRRQTRAASSGLLVARSARGVVLGFAPWWVRPDLQLRSRFWSGPVVAAEPASGGQVHQALAAALEELAMEHVDGQVRIILDDFGAESPLHQLGFKRDGVIVRRAKVGDALGWEG